MNLQYILTRVLELKFIEGYRSQILGILYALIVLLQGQGYLDDYWDRAEQVKGAIFGLMSLTMTGKFNRVLAAIQGKKVEGGT